MDSGVDSKLASDTLVSDNHQRSDQTVSEVCTDTISAISSSDATTLCQSNSDTSRKPTKAIAVYHEHYTTESPPFSLPHLAQPQTSVELTRQSIPIHPQLAVDDADPAHQRVSQASDLPSDPHSEAVHASTQLHRVSTGASIALSGNLETSISDETVISHLSFLRRSTDGTLSIVLPRNPIWLLVFILHYILIFGYNVTVLYYQVTSSGPNTVEKDMDRMQTFFGKLAHDDAVKIVEAIQGKTVDDEKKWDAIHDVIKACMLSVHKNSTDTACSKALSKFDLQSDSAGLPVHANSRRLAERKLGEITDTLQKQSDYKATNTNQDVMVVAEIALGLVFTMLIGTLIFCSRRKGWDWGWLQFGLRRNTDAHTKPDQEKAPVDHAKNITVLVSGSETPGQIGHPPLRRRLLASRGPTDIWTAILQQDLETVAVIRAGSREYNVNQTHQRYGSLLSAAARCGHTPLVSQLLEWGADVTITGGDFHNVLQAAAHSGDFATLKVLLDAGARDETIGGHYSTAINAAAEKGTSTMVYALLEKQRTVGERVNVPGGKYHYALTAAAARGHLETVKILLGAGAEIDAADDSGVTALHVACAGGHDLTAEFLANHGADINKSSSIHGTPVLAACQSRASAIAHWLLSAGANINHVDDNGRTPLIVAINNGMTDLAKMFIQQDPTRLNVQDIHGSTALHYCAIKGNASITALLLDYNADVAIGDKFQAQPLFRAAGCHHAEVARLLIERGNADVNAVDCFGQTALHGPAEDENVEVQELLIQAGANVNARGARKVTPLHEACNMGRFHNVKLLLECSQLDVNAVDDDSTTPLCRAICSTDGRYRDKCIDERIVLLMLETSSELNVNLCNGLALQEACRKGMIDVVKLMLQKKETNVRVEGGKYGSALQAAAIGGSVEVLELLIQNRADANQVGGEYGSPLAASAAFGQLAAVKFLLENGADPSLKSIGRYWSAYNSVGRAMTDVPMSLYQREDIIRTIKGMIESADLEATEVPSVSQMEHLRDRWILLTTGWDWYAEGEL